MRDENLQGDAAGGRDETPRCEIQDLATLLRAGADGELSAAEQARLDEHLSASEGDAARIGFERGLRAACGRAMGAEKCPDALRARIERIAAESNPGFGEDIEARATETRSASFWNSPRVLGAFGAAAAIALMFTIGAVLIGQPGATAPGGGGGGAVPASDLSYVAYRDEVAQFVAGEHGRCRASDEAADAKFVMKDRDSVVAGFRNLLGGDIHIPALDQPVESIVFRGGGRCGLPKTKGAAHLRWDVPANGDTPASAVSMFVAPDNGILPIEEGVTYSVNTKACGAGGSSLLVWTQGGVVHCLISEKETGACEKFRKQMGAPAKTEGL